MRFDFSYFGKALGWTGGFFYLLDIFWFAHSGSNIDYNLGFVVGLFIGAAICSIRRRT